MSRCKRGFIANQYRGEANYGGVSVRRIKFFALISLFLGAFAVLTGFIARADADIFYTVETTEYATGSAGVITKSGSAFSVRKNVVTNLPGDSWGFTFKDHNGDLRAMVREYNYGPNDGVYVWNPSDWSKPVINRSDWGSNFHAVSANGQYLYLTTYESYAGGGGNEDTGEVVRVDMKNGYVRDAYHHYERFTSDAGNVLSPHAEGVYASGGKIYVLYAMPYNGVYEYEASEIVEYDSNLNVLSKVQLKNSSGAVGKNAAHMAYYGGKLYVVCMGGYQGPESWGDIWEVDISNMTARQVLDGQDIPYEMSDGTTAAVGMYGIQFASDGTAFILTGSYSASNTFRARLFVTTASNLSNVNEGNVVVKFGAKSGYSWDILWDESASTLWCMAGTELQARAKNGGLIRTFTPSELGDNIYSISLLNGGSTPVDPDDPDDADDPNGSDDPDDTDDPNGSDDPDDADDSDTQVPDIQPVKPSLPGDAPSNVESATPAILTGESGLSSFSNKTGIPTAWMKEGAGGYVLDSARAKERAENLWSGVTKTESLPAFTANLDTAGDVVAVGLTVKGSVLMAKTPGEIKLMKVLSGSKTPLKFSYDASGYGDGTFMLQKSDGSAHTGAISDGTTYTLVLFIKDGGSYDLDGRADKSVIDPAVIVSAGGTSGNNNGNDTGGGGGGCDTGAAALFILLAAVSINRRQKRQGTEGNAK
jgi:hypothetical protein